MVWPAVIAAGASIAGGLMGAGSADKQKDAQLANADADRALAIQMANEGIRWRVADARAAGIHPLYALGAQLPSHSPTTFIPGETGHLGRGIAEAGQHIGRAVEASTSSTERLTSRINALAVDRAELENELLRSKIAREKGQIGPPLPMAGASTFMPGQGDPERMGLTVKPASSHVDQKPQEVGVANPRNTSMEPQAVTDRGFIWTGSGYAPVPSKDAKDRMEDMMIPELAWSLRNNLLPNLGDRSNEPPADLIPEGFNSWRWSYSKQEWQPHYNPHRARIPVRKGGGQ